MRKMPVYLINGFLGSGKTTMMLKMIKKLQDKGLKVAVLLNELGQTNLERHMFKEDNFFELLNGCICCSLQDDLKKVMRDLSGLYKDGKVDVAVIEGTGVANPGEIHEILNQHPFSDLFSLQESVCITDASMLQEYLSFFSSSKEVRNLQKQQIHHASYIVLNKIDLIDHKADLEKVRKLVRKINPDAILKETSYGDCIEDLFQTHSSLARTTIKNEEKYAHHREIKAVKIQNTANVGRNDIHRILSDLTEDMIRAKGTIYDQSEAQWYHFQYASGKLQWEKVKKMSSSLHGEIIFIGTNLSREKVLL
ncbi:CobW family GTP-binding protein [Bacillus mesophilum]|uniref:GTP-binding protein n=1 Tax=Bacillus mesophilum TaxID=1071718 RepID=A0A7V7UV81_9BACI|nr:CobW family GTP-binding protein [Bacillus mesophilum]KAB2332792.1 GTP-binding protein [Bacillus mesophilum]